MPGVPVTVYRATLTLSQWQWRRELTQAGSRSRVRQEAVEAGLAVNVKCD